MATRPARPRPSQAQSAQAQPVKAQSAKAQPVKAQSARAQAVKARSATAQAAKARSAAAPAPAAQPRPPVALPRELRLAAGIQAVEAAGLLVAAGFAAVATADGKSYEKSSGIALTLIAVATAALFASFAVGLTRSRPWTRVPVVMFQLAIGFWGVFLLTGHRYEWGVPMLVVAAATLVCVFTPASLRALNRPAPPPA